MMSPENLAVKAYQLFLHAFKVRAMFAKKVDHRQ